MSVASGSTSTYTLSVTGGTSKAGLDVAASSGTLAAGTGTKIQNGEVTHSSPSGPSWTFSWTAPTVTTNTSATLWAAAINSFGGGTGTLQQAITVTAPAPTMGVSPTSLAFAFTTGGSVPAAKTIAVSSSGPAFSYTVSATTSTGGSWLSATGGGTTPGNVTVSVNPGSLAAGTYNGTVTITSSTASNSPQTVPVTLTVTAPAPAPTINLSPTSLSFAYATGGSAPAAKTIAVSSSGTAFSYTASATTSTGGNWLSATGSGSTPGNVSVSVNPGSLAAGTYNGTVTITSAGASNSPQTVPVTLTVTASATPSLTLNPASLTFNYQTGSAAPAAQNVNVGSSGTALAYTAMTSAAWLMFSPASGNTPGTLSVSVNPSGMAVGTYNGSVTITSAGASNSPQQVAVTLRVTSPTTTGGRLRVSPSQLQFDAPKGSSNTLSKSVQLTSTGSPLNFTASTYGGSWLSVDSSGGSTPSTIAITVNPAGLASGRYKGVVRFTAANSRGASVTVSLQVGRKDDDDDDDGGAETDRVMSAQPYVHDPAKSGAIVAQWVDGAGVPSSDTADPDKQGLLLLKNSMSSTRAQAGVQVMNVQGMKLTQLGYDIRTGSSCTAANPMFLVVTSDDVVHQVGGCTQGTMQSSPAAGWQRLRFNPAQAKPAIASGSQVKSIYLVVDEGPGAGLVVLDNINVNGTFLGSE